MKKPLKLIAMSVLCVSCLLCISPDSGFAGPKPGARSTALAKPSNPPRTVPNRVSKVPGALPQIQINRGGQIRVRTVSAPFERAVTPRSPKRDFSTEAGVPVPKVLIKPDKTKRITPRKGIATPTYKIVNGVRTTKNGGVSIYHGKDAPITRIHPPTKSRGRSPEYPTGYITQGFKGQKQPVHPKTFEKIHKSDRFAHEHLGRPQQTSK